MTEKGKTKIALVLGGTSPERDVSKSSGKSIYDALKSLGYEIKLIDPAYGINQPDDEDKFFHKEDFSKISNYNYLKCVSSELFNDIDLAFLALHGIFGEDGTIQSLFELRGIKYTGSKVLASSISMDKVMSKRLFKHFGINTPDWIELNKNGIETEEVIKLINEKFGFPCVIKPNDQGSTVGLTICRDASEIKDALKLSFKYSNKTLIEEFVPGHEVTVAVLKDKALPVLEIKPKHNVYDYECKYTSGMSEYEVPAKFPEEVLKEVQSQALKAFNAVGGSIYGRMDFRVSSDFIPYCLEVNTLPGMTSTSLVPKMAKAVGISFEQLIDTIIKSSM